MIEVVVSAYKSKYLQWVLTALALQKRSLSVYVREQKNKQDGYLMYRMMDLFRYNGHKLVYEYADDEGLGKNLKELFSKIKGDWFIYVEHDDVVPFDYIEKLWNCRFDGVGMVGVIQQDIDDWRYGKDYLEVSDDRKYAGMVKTNRKGLEEVEFCPIGGALLRKSAIDLSVLDEPIEHWHKRDKVLVRRMKEKGYKILVNNDIVIRHIEEWKKEDFYE